MADRIVERERGGSMGVIGVIVGALIVIALAYFLLNGNTFSGGGSSTNVTIEAPKAPSVPAAPAAPAAPR
ncbi:MAG: hypothetical protein JWN93_2922 [Hyphomicrobiales bacterium]|nr:hypothetical protein [Hyphomicrobiales bacterium]